MPNYPYNHGGGGGRSNGGNVRFLRAQERGDLPRWTWTPRHEWACKILASDLAGSSSTQMATVTIPAAGFVSGRLTLTFSGGGLASPVAVVADAAVGDANTDLATAMGSALTTAISGDLSGVLSSATVDSNLIYLGFVQGIDMVSVTPTWRSAEVYEIEFVGTLIDSDYTVTISGGGLGAPVAVTTQRSGGSPAAITDMIIQREADLEGEAGLSGVLVSADDDGATLNTLQFEPDIADVTVTATENPLSIALQFGGTPTDGFYGTTFTHSSIPGGSAAVYTQRSGGVPATNLALAQQHEADIEADLRLVGIIASANDDGVDTNIVIAYAGVTGLTATTEAPSPGTLTRTALDQTVTDVTPAGPTVTVNYELTLDLNSLAAVGRFPQHVVRRCTSVRVTEAFGASRTITVGDAAAADGLAGASPIDLNAVAHTVDSAATQYLGRYESALVPTATLNLGSSNTVTTGEVYVYIDFVGAPCKEGAGT